MQKLQNKKRKKKDYAIAERNNTKIAEKDLKLQKAFSTFSVSLQCYQ